MRAPSAADIDSRASIAHLGSMVVIAHDRLTKAVGTPRATEIIRGAVAALGERRFDRPQDLLDLAGQLIKAGGLVQMVGHSLKVQALLRGAVEF